MLSLDDGAAATAGNVESLLYVTGYSVEDIVCLGEKFNVIIHILQVIKAF